MATLKSKKGVEIFSVGTWNGTEITLADLDEMITAFEDMPNYQLPLKLGHDPEQKILQTDGYPAAGWIEKIYRKGEKLVADFKDIPAKIYELIENKAYKQVSSEVFFNVNVGEKKYRRMLAGVALLGADVPGVMNLNDMLAMYGHKNYESMHSIVYDKDQQPKPEIHIFVMEDKMSKTENELKLEMQLEAEKAQFTKAQEELKKAQDEKAAQEKEVTELRQFKAEQEKKDLETQASLKKAKLEKFVSDLKTDKLCTPAMESLVMEIMGEEKQNYTIRLDEKNEKTFDSKQDLLKECFTLLREAAKVNFAESSEDGKTAGEKLTEKEIVEKIEKYAAEKSVSFKQARRELGIELPKAAKI